MRLPCITADELAQSSVSLQDCRRAHAETLPLATGELTQSPVSLRSHQERAQGENTIYFHNALSDKLLLYHSLPLVFSSGKAFHG